MAYNLTSATPLKDTDALLQDLQCNILAPHRRKHSAHLFVTLPPDAASYARNWAARATPAARPAIQQTKRIRQIEKWQEKQTLWRKTFYKTAQAILPVSWDFTEIRPPAAKRDLVKSIMFTSNALDGSRLNRPDAVPLLGEKEFYLGAFATEAPRFGSVANWTAPFTDNNLEAQLLLAADNPVDVLNALAEEIGELVNCGGRVLGLRHGYVAKNSANQAMENFGYVDGLSNPVCLESELKPSMQTNTYNPFYPLKNFLFNLPESPNACGSFVVLREIEQDVAAFNQLTVQQRDAAVGRSPDGTPMQPSIAGDNNDFSYPATKAPGKCPFHAHIRKANPRFPEPSNRQVIFARRGVLYGDRSTDLKTGLFNDAPQTGAGLLFMGYMGSINQQFARMQEDWLNSPGFPSLDPLSGPDKLASPFTTVKGGAFFFVPPLSWLRSL